MRPLREARWGILLGVGLVGVHLIAGSALFENSSAEAGELTTWKSSTCSFCAKWIELTRAAGFSTVVRDVEHMLRIKPGQGGHQPLGSCHTVVVDGCVLEGQVPASEVTRLWTKNPTLTRLSVPGMLASAPDTDMDHPNHPYDVVTFGRTGDGLYASQ